jgi:hypothetical protein
MSRLRTCSPRQSRIGLRLDGAASSRRFVMARVGAPARKVAHTSRVLASASRDRELFRFGKDLGFCPPCKRLLRRDAATSTRHACATQNSAQSGRFVMADAGRKLASIGENNSNRVVFPRKIMSGEALNRRPLAAAPDEGAKWQPPPPKKFNFLLAIFGPIVHSRKN